MAPNAQFRPTANGREWRTECQKASGVWPVKVRPDNIAELAFMPTTCAYRLLAQGEDLPWWHPLVSGKRGTVYQAGMSVRHRVISRMKARDLPEETTPRHAAPEVEQIEDDSEARTTVLTR